MSPCMTVDKFGDCRERGLRHESPAAGVLRSRRYSHPPLRFSTGRILMNASTAWILPS
jgi:hypothetical protein